MRTNVATSSGAEHRRAGLRRGYWKARPRGYARALGALNARQETRMVFGLARVRRVLARLGDPQEAFASIHVAGTNGKGSVCAMLDSILRAAGHRVGLYTSPHLHDVRERIRVGGGLVSRPAFARAVWDVLAAETEPLTYFELVTAAAFVHFRRAGVRLAVLETGLGGRLDATNVVRRPLACVIPSIDFDHTDWLGRSLAQIAREKAGILKPGAPAFTAEVKPAALRALRSAASRRSVSLSALPSRTGWRLLGVDWDRGRQRVGTPEGRRAELGLLGEVQLRNAALAREALRPVEAAGFGIGERAFLRGLERVRWPGRFEVLRLGRRRVILDGAHNPQAMDRFCRTLAASPWAGSRKLFVVGVLRDKDTRAIARRLAPLVSHAIAVEPPSPRALGAGELASQLLAAKPRARVTALRRPQDALDAWRRSGAPVACVVGSFYLVAAVRRALGARP
ncbi:MAG: bifunctional folylpolyglutamate synthase/dihydrofolate synthase [Elusimicrobia bacterium]|nr:bifunctional folylpolyglutamate synthase/dihydrofolate synthase [Elusimicrobiota bacterium]